MFKYVNIKYNKTANLIIIVGTYKIPHGYTFPLPVGTDISEYGMVNAFDIQYQQPIITQVHVIARDE